MIEEDDESPCVDEASSASDLGIVPYPVVMDVPVEDLLQNATLPLGSRVDVDTPAGPVRLLERNRLDRSLPGMKEVSHLRVGNAVKFLQLFDP